MTTIEMSVLTMPYVANSERPTTHDQRPTTIDCLSKLLQEPHIALKEKLNIIHAILQNRNPLHAHAERKPRNLRRIVVHEAVHIRIDHAAAQQLNPSAGLAVAAGTAAARGFAVPEDANDLHVGARLSKWEE